MAGAAGPSLLARCRSCGAVNRIPTARAADTGRCGRCRADLPAGSFHADAPLEVSGPELHLVARVSRLPLLVELHAPWCGACRAMQPVLDRYARDMAGKLVVLKVNIDLHPTEASRYRIEGTPTLLLLRHGTEVARATGALPLGQLRSWVGQHV